MSPDSREHAVELETEQEVDFGRYWRAVAARWWLLALGVALGALVGFLVSLSGGQIYKATAQIYLGQPLAPDSASPVSTAPTTLGLVTAFVTAEETIRRAAALAGIKPGKLRDHVTARAIPGVSNTRQAQPAPLLSVSVTGSSRAKTQIAANALARAVVGEIGTYSDTKVETLEQQLTYIDRQLEVITRRIDSARASQEEIVANKNLSPTEKLVALTNLNSEISLSEQRQATLELNRFNTRRALSLATDVEQARVTTSAIAVKTAAKSRSTGVIVGAFIGLLLGIIVALAWDPVAGRARPATA
jgi:capsular polysaccharide biosynthesis protein